MARFESRKGTGDLRSPFTAILSIVRLESGELRCAFAEVLSRCQVQKEKKSCNRIDFWENQVAFVNVGSREAKSREAGRQLGACVINGHGGAHQMV